MAAEMKLHVGCLRKRERVASLVFDVRVKLIHATV